MSSEREALVDRLLQRAESNWCAGTHGHGMLPEQRDAIRSLAKLARIGAASPESAPPPRMPISAIDAILDDVVSHIFDGEEVAHLPIVGVTARRNEPYGVVPLTNLVQRLQDAARVAYAEHTPALQRAPSEKPSPESAPPKWKEIPERNEESVTEFDCDDYHRKKAVLRVYRSHGDGDFHVCMHYIGRDGWLHLSPSIRVCGGGGGGHNRDLYEALHDLTQGRVRADAVSVSPEKDTTTHEEK